MAPLFSDYSLFAGELANPLLQPDILIATTLLVLALLAGAFAAFYAERWKKKALQPDEAVAADDLAEFRTMFEHGELTEEEYGKIRQRTAQRLKQELGMAPSPPPANSRPSAPPPSLN